MKQIRIEFFGIPRQRAGVASLNVSIADDTTLGDVLAVVARELPAFADACLQGSRLRSGYLACINGRTFAADSSVKLRVSDSVQILSADVGG